MRSARLTALAAATFLALFASRGEADQTLTFDGEVPATGPDHFFIPFTVPDGTVEIEIRHENLNAANIIDWGLDDANGYRGWGGGTTEAAIVGQDAASRAYVPGPIARGTWNIIAGKAKIVASPALYHIDVILRTAPTLAPQAGRSKYQPAPPRKTGARYYAGDLHAHSLESTDAKPPILDMISFAKGRRLDFLEVSDHNTITQQDFFNGLQANEPDLLLVPGIEYTTYAGHANAIGATVWVDHKIGQPGVTINGAADRILGQGALFSINHPMLDLGNVCIGCAWKHDDLDLAKVRGVEIGTGGIKEGARFFSTQSIAFWDAICQKGHHVAALGGSDDHSGGKDTGAPNFSPIGNPTTLVYASDLSVTSILDGIAHGRTVVKLENMDDPMVEFTADGFLPGESRAVRSTLLRAVVTGGAAIDGGARVRFVKNGVPQEEKDVTSDPFVTEIVATAPDSGEDRWRAEVIVDERPRTVTSHVWVTRDANGPAATLPDSPGAGGSGGCSVARGSSAPFGIAGALALLGLLLGAARRLPRW